MKTNGKEFAVDLQKLEVELDRVSGEGLLLRNETYDVYAASAERIPTALQEIGRLRALAFPDADAPGGVELDGFDATYLHLFVWHRQNREIVGGYRLGCTDLLGAKMFPAALYTHSLFDFDTRFLKKLGPAIELGRSFVREEYQRSSLVLELLWKGIGCLVASAPRYRFLFGALTIDHEFRLEARELLLDYLDSHGVDPDWQELVTPRNPVRATQVQAALEVQIPDTMAELARRFAELDHHAHRIPVLLRQYLRMGARSLGYSADPLFGGSIDALILVDMHACHPRLLSRYLGEEATRAVRRGQDFVGSA